MGRWCIFRHNENRFDYKFWFGCQASGFDFLDNVIDIKEWSEHRVVEDENDEDENKQALMKWMEENELKLDEWYKPHEIFERAGFKSEWEPFVLEDDDITFEISVNCEELIDFIASHPYFLPDFEISVKFQSTDDIYDTLKHLSEKSGVPEEEEEECEANYCLACCLYHFWLVNGEPEVISGWYEC
jgi:hypothetical protein